MRIARIAAPTFYITTSYIRTYILANSMSSPHAATTACMHVPRLGCCARHMLLTLASDVELPPARDKVIREINEQAVTALAVSACGVINKAISWYKQTAFVLSITSTPHTPSAPLTFAAGTKPPAMAAALSSASSPPYCSISQPACLHTCLSFASPTLSSCASLCAHLPASTSHLKWIKFTMSSSDLSTPSSPPRLCLPVRLPLLLIMR